jgi:hypothetical protein
VIWTWGPGELDRPHHATLLENNNILIFDNGSRRGYSRVLELNPVTGKVVWKYVADPLGSFYSWGMGAAIGPAMGGFIFDANRSYHVAFLIGALAVILVTVLVAFLRKEVKTGS